MGREQLTKGVDYYTENGRWVFTANYLKKRGYCCDHGCRYCPYKDKPVIEPGAYIWKSKDVDYPVTVIENIGQGPDGREYVKVAECSTGIPADELVKVKSVQSTSRRPPRRRLFQYLPPVR